MRYKLNNCPKRYDLLVVTRLCHHRRTEFIEVVEVSEIVKFETAIG